MASPDTTMTRIRAPRNLPDLVKRSFEAAKASGDITYYPTQVELLSVHGIPFQLRFSPALANKPKSASGAKSGGDKPRDPFDNPNPKIVIAHLPAPQTPSSRTSASAAASTPSNLDAGENGHTLVLNKFAIVPEHFILATTAFKPQTHLLEQADLEATWACLEAYSPPASASQESRSGGLYAFFNSGPHSGASQPHRHIQLLPVERMRDGMKAGENWAVLADSLAGDKSVAAKVPFTTFGQRLDRGVSGEELHQTYLRLYREAVKAVDAVAKDLAQHDKSSEAEEIKQGRSKDDDQQESAHGVNASQTGVGEEARISYNMALTLDAIVIMPRVAEGSAVHDTEGKQVGQLQLNGTVLAGTALVKNESEWNALRNDERQLVDVLGKIGVRQA